MSLKKLPINYRLIRSLDLKKDKGLTTLLNIVGTIIFLVIVGLGFVISPFPENFDFEITHLFLLIGGIVGYIILHELLHALFMKIFIKEKLSIGLRWKAAYAGMKKAYFKKGEYALIALAPVLILGISLLLLIIFLPGTWFWPLHIIQGQNLAGAVGDYYVVGVLTKMPKHTLVNDDGMSMRYYAPSEDKIIEEETDNVEETNFDFL
jgi:hypothetical protein